ncbi:mechanosensitive ion channel domain-containing protein [Desulfoluna spongiiphila]|uniref:Mechanosensitive ion channel n=1 Tax=Desulfoluna spongiiphila TaxID=419481 RepID=A0A1G5EP55_9BACT|nr:mechanosensitive ion channel domain-containing protein [Desulfoluna spongiiphila]SCY28746.1 Mechanosensitive ion channel [Desulfoluna spongiiphila]
MKRCVLILSALLLLILPTLCGAEDKAWYMVDEIRLNAIRVEVGGWGLSPPPPEVINKRLATLQTLMESASKCVEDTEKELSQVEIKAAVLGDPVASDDSELARRRSTLEADRKNLEQRLAICRLLNLSARELQKQIITWRQKNFTSALLDRQQPVWKAITALPALIASPQKLYEFKTTTHPDTNLMLLAGFFPLLLLLPLILTLDRRIKSWSAEDPELKRHKAALMFTRRLPAIALLTSTASGFYAGGILTLAAPVGALAIALALSPLVERYFSKETLGVPASFPLRVLITVALLAEALVIADIESRVPEVLAILARSVLMIALLGASVRVLWTLSRHPRLALLKSIRFPLIFCLAFGPVADWLGYRHLAGFATVGVLGTLTGGLVTWAIILGVHKIQDLLTQVPAEQTARTLRHALGYTPEEQIKGLKLITRGLTVIIFLAYGMLVTKIWGKTALQTTTLGNFFLEGFRVGNTVIVPVRIILAVFLFFLILNLSRWLKHQMGEKWLTHTNFDKGEKQSIVTLTGYVLTGFALFYSLSIAGLEFKNLAIIAGALSVGIGFGLQNIVNNFVSGLILLFERPVRPGDWVVVGETEGYVKRVSIRFTHIQTFDRADVLVPNSDLIANQVTNWMLGDPFGRVMVHVGVAYGTDTRKVHDLMMQIAEDHPMVLTNGRLVPKPRVLFKGFGDSALDFELRCHIRDIDYRMSVRSELLFAIDDAFRKENIEIPFPQRVLHRAAAPRDEVKEDDKAEDDTAAPEKSH